MNQNQITLSVKMLSDAEQKAIDPRLKRTIAVKKPEGMNANILGLGQYKDGSLFIGLYESVAGGDPYLIELRQSELSYEAAIKLQTDIVAASVSSVSNNNPTKSVTDAVQSLRLGQLINLP